MHPDRILGLSVRGEGNRKSEGKVHCNAIAREASGDLMGSSEQGWPFRVVPIEVRGLGLSSLSVIKHWM